MDRRKSLLFFIASLIYSFSIQATSPYPELPVGAVFPMTGPTATYGQESVNGIKMALKEINQRKVKGRKIRLLIEDNKGEPMESANAVRKLINIDKVAVVLGSVASSNTKAGAPIAQEAKVPLLTPASTNEEVTTLGEYISRTCFTDNFQGLVMAKFAFEVLKKKKVAIIIDNSSDYSKGLAKVFSKKFKEYGGEIIDKEFSYIQNDNDFRTLLIKVKRSQPDAIYLPGYYTDVGKILRQARSLKIMAPFLGGDGWDSPKLQEIAGAEGVKGNYISSHFSSDDSDPYVQKFVKEYMENYKMRPGAMAALGHDAILVLEDALKRSKDFSSESIKDAINSTINFKGVTGLITIDKNRNAKKSAVVLETTMKGNIFAHKINP